MKKLTESTAPLAAAEHPARAQRLQQLPTSGGIYSYDPGSRVMTRLDGQSQAGQAEDKPATPGEPS